MAGEIATAYVSLIPSGKDLGKDTEKQLGDVGDRAGDKAGAGFTSKLGGFLKKSVIGVGLAAGGLLATSLVKGWGRLTNIENATAKLTGLGNSGKAVSGIMDNALKSVKGTAFGLDEAATTAAGVVAAGIKPGKELQSVLNTVADTATIAGKSMADTGAIFGSVAARGKLQGDDLLQLQSAGVPVLAMLAKHYGITAAAASQMVTKGAVDFKNFNAALQENLGGAALKSGETTQGAFKNMGAALSRFGAVLLKDIFPLAKVVFGGITSALDAMGAKAGPMMDKLVGWASAVNGKLLGLLASNSWGDAFKAISLGLQGVTDDNKLDGLSASLYGVGVALGKFRDIFTSVFAGFGAAIKSAFSGDFSGLMDIGGRLVDAITPQLPKLLVGGQMLILKLIDGALNMLPKLLPVAEGVITALVDGIAGILPKLAAAAAPIISKLIDALSKALPQLLTVGVSAVQTLIKGVVSVLPQIVKLAVQLVNQLVTALIGALPQIISAATQLVMALIGGITKMLPSIVSAALSLVQNLVSGLTQSLPQIVTAAVQLVSSLISGIVSMLPQIVSAAINLAATLVTALIGALPTLVDAGLQLLMGVISGIVDNLSKIVDAASNVVTSLIEQVTTLLPTIVTAGLSMLTSIISGIVDNLPKIVTAATTAVTALLDQLVAMLPDLITGGLGLLVGVINGIINNLPKIIDAAITLVGSLVTGLLNNLPKIIDAGLQLLVGVINGILTNLPKLIDAAIQLVTKLTTELLSPGNIDLVIKAAIGLLTGLVTAILDPKNLLALVKAAPEIVNALIKGIIAMGSALWDAIVSLVSGKTLSVAVQFLGDFWQDMKNMASGKSGILTGSNLDPLKGLPGHALGGPIPSNQLSIVGERGPELFMPSTSGFMVPNHQLGGADMSETNSLLRQLLDSFDALPRRQAQFAMAAR